MVIILFASPTGALTVSGGVGIGGNAYVGGNLFFSGLLTSPIFESTSAAAGLSTVSFESIPAWANVFEIHYTSVQHNSGTSICPVVTIGTSLGYFTSGYSGISYNQTGATSLTASSNIPIFHVAFASTVSLISGFMRFHKLPEYSVNVPPLMTYQSYSVEGNALNAATPAACQIVAGSVVLSAQRIDRIRIQTGTAATFTGNMRVTFRYY